MSTVMKKVVSLIFIEFDIIILSTYDSQIVQIWNESLLDMECSGDIDGRVPVTSTKYSLNKMKLPVKTEWHPWFLGGEVT